MDVLNGGIMHTACTTSIGIECALDYSTEDGRADRTPVKVLTGVVQKQLNNLIGELGIDYVLLGE